MSSIEIVDPSVVKGEVIEYIGSVVEDARMLSLAITDDATCEKAVTLGSLIKQKMAWLKKRREVVYEPLKSATENVRLEFDTPLKLGKQIEDTLSAAIITYRQKKRDEETRARLALEAKAKQEREEAARKEREAQAERERIIRDRELAEQKKRDEAAAKERRKREKEEADRREVAAKAQADADARAKQLKDEQDARLKTAQEAHDQGLAERSENILEKQMPVAPLPAPLPSAAELAAKAEAEKQAEADRMAEYKRKEEERVAEQKKRDEDAAILKRMDDEASLAAAKAAESEAVAAQQITVTRPDDRMSSNVRWYYDVPNEEAFRKLCLAIGERRAPVEYGGFDPLEPQKFRGCAVLQKDVTRQKDTFQGDAIGIRTWPEERSSFKVAA